MSKIKEFITYPMVRTLILPLLSWCGCPLYHTGKHKNLTLGSPKASAVQLLLDPLQKLLYPPVWSFALYHFHQLVHSEETARQKIMAARGSNVRVIMAA